MMVRRRREKAMLRAVRPLRNLLRKAFLTTKWGSVITDSIPHKERMVGLSHSNLLAELRLYDRYPAPPDADGLNRPESPPIA